MYIDQLEYVEFSKNCTVKLSKTEIILVFDNKWIVYKHI